MKIPSLLTRLKTTFSIQLILGLLLIVVSIFTVAYVSKYLDARKETKAKEQAILTEQKKLSIAALAQIWDTLAIPQINVSRARLKTKYSDDQVQYKVAVDVGYGFDNYAFNQAQYPFVIAFIGDDDFEVLQIELSQNEKTNIVNGNGKNVGIEFSGAFTAQLDKYLAAKKWSLIWRF